MNATRKRAEPQSAPAVLLIRPRHFASNPETLGSNRFQMRGDASRAVAAAAEHELDALAVRLARQGVRVHVFAGRADAALPDEVFPNNWASFHVDGTAVLYPMMAPSRRAERRPELLDALRAQGYGIERVVDLTRFESRGQFLEGTGSVVLDRVGRVAYACASPRTAREPLEAFGAELGYEVVPFTAVDRTGTAVYHTNVLMSVGTSFAVLCAAAIPSAAARKEIVRRLEESGRELIELTMNQLHAFAGNLLELATPAGPLIALSARALSSLVPAQRAALARHGRLLDVDIPTIERHGGGSVRCMLAEIALPEAGM